MLETKSAEESADYIDPVAGVRVLYFPHQRVPIILRTDVGGFGIGSDISWTAVLNTGYTLSPQIDLIAGFAAYGSKFTGESKAGNTASLSMVMYGFDLGIKIMIPRRYKDPAVFKKTGKK